MSGLIGHLILLSKAGETTKAQLNKVPFDLTKLLSQSREDFELLAEGQHKKLTISCPPETVVKTDEKYLTEIIHILLDNAVKYCDDNGTIAIDAEKGKKKDSILLTVSNDYKDGAHVDYSRFFERFYRNDESHNSKKRVTA